IQLHLDNAELLTHGKTRPDRDGDTIHACQLRPESLGTVGLNSADPFDDPMIDPNYFATEGDRRTLRDSVRMTREIVSQSAFDAYRGAEMRPGVNVKSDAEIDAWVREYAETIYHPVGTCRMGADEKSVVDAQLKVRGIASLRVVDASIMPTLIGGNTNAPTIMVAEKASDMIRGRAALPAEDAPIAEDAQAAA
ncbi:MAG: GMC oxidoreductase, partial [Hyphomonadaceae bacterium]